MNNSITSTLRGCASLPTCLCAIALSACSGGSSDSGVNTPRINSNGTFISVTYQDMELGNDSGEALYYSSLEVGIAESYEVRIANEGADKYTLNELRLEGDNADEFGVDIIDGLVLEAADVVSTDVSFAPITEGNKSANLVIDFETTRLVEESVNLNERSFYDANDLALSGRFKEANDTYTTYLENDPVTVNADRAAIRLPIITEGQVYDGEADLSLYLQAMGQRENKEYDRALASLDQFEATYTDSYLADDALYLRGYIQLMDLEAPEEAMVSMQSLREQHPDTTYYDTSLYSEAIAGIEVGNEEPAREILQDLKERHTGMDALGISFPKDNLVSRLWFERAGDLLDTLPEST